MTDRRTPVRSPGQTEIPTPIEKDQALPPGRAKAFGQFVLLGSLSLMGSLSIDVYLPALPDITRNLRATPVEGQVSITACLIGLAVGQFLWGPSSDKFGRRGPLMYGVALFALSCGGCALAHSMTFLTISRLAQGFGASAGIVISRAIVSDRYDGHAAARVFSLLILVTGVGPMFAPQLGAVTLQLGSWRYIFLLLGAAATALLLVTAMFLSESLPDAARSGPGAHRLIQQIKALGRSASFVGYAATCALAFGAIFVYVAGSPFLLRDSFGFSVGEIGTIYTVNGVMLVIASQINAALLARFTAASLLKVGVWILTLAGILLAAWVVFLPHDVYVVLVSFLLVMGSVGFIGPNGTALALEQGAGAAGSASAFVGSGQFLIGAAAAPLAGVMNGSPGVMLATGIFGFAALSQAARFIAAAWSRRQPPLSPD